MAALVPPTRRQGIQQPAKTIGHRFRQGKSWKVVMGCRYGVGGHHGLVGEFSARREVYIRIVLRILPLNYHMYLGRCFFLRQHVGIVEIREQFLRTRSFCDL